MARCAHGHRAPRRRRALTTAPTDDDRPAGSGGVAVAFLLGVGVTLALLGCYALTRVHLGGQPTRSGVLPAELWDPATGAWSEAGSLPAPREEHVMAQLAGGDVIVAGGNWLNQDVRQTLTWNPQTMKFAPAGEIDLYDNAQRAIAVGDRVAVFSGRDNSDESAPGTKAALFAGGRWTALVPPLKQAFRAVTVDTAARAPGSVRVFFDEAAADWAPASNQWTVLPETTKLFPYVRGGLALASPEWGIAMVPIACTVSEKQCAFAGGKAAERSNALFAAHEPSNWWLYGLIPLGGARLLIPLEGAAYVWKPGSDEAALAPWPDKLDKAYAVAGLRDGRALLTGGHWEVDGEYWNATKAVVYDPAGSTPSDGGALSGAWTETARMHHGRSFHAALTLHDGRVLVTGGGVMSATPVGLAPQVTACVLALLILAALIRLWRRRTTGRVIAFVAGVLLTLAVAGAALFVVYAAGSAIKG